MKLKKKLKYLKGGNKKNKVIFGLENINKYENNYVFYLVVALVERRK